MSDKLNNSEVNKTITTTTTKEFREKREFILNKEVNSSNIESIAMAIHELNRIDDIEERKNTYYIREPIKIIVDSYGGNVYDGNLLLGTIDSSKTPVHTYCYSKAMSMGFAIFISGHKRFAHPLATFMYHDAGTTLAGTLNSIEKALEQLKKLVKRMDLYIIQATKLSQNKLDEIKNANTNWYMFADEAMELGIVDELIKR